LGKYLRAAHFSLKRSSEEANKGAQKDTTSGRASYEHLYIMEPNAGALSSLVGGEPLKALALKPGQV